MNSGTIAQPGYPGGLWLRDEQAGSPDPRIDALVCARLGAGPDETVFLDDRDPYVTAARRAGIRAICYRDSAQAIGEIETLLR